MAAIHRRQTGEDFRSCQSRDSRHLTRYSVFGSSAGGLACSQILGRDKVETPTASWLVVNTLSVSSFLRVEPRTSQISLSSENFGLSFYGTPYKCIFCKTRTRLSNLYSFSTILWIFRHSTRRCPKPIISRAILYHHSWFSATLAAIVQMFLDGSDSGVLRSIAGASRGRKSIDMT